MKYALKAKQQDEEVEYYTTVTLPILCNSLFSIIGAKNVPLPIV